MKLISTVTHHGERDVVLAVLEDGSSFLAPVFDGEGELIAYYEGEMEKLGELVREFVTGTAQRESISEPAEVPFSESHPPAKNPPRELIPSRPGGPTSGPDGSVLLSDKTPCPDCHSPTVINHSKPGGPNGIPEEILSILRELARASVATRNLVVKLAADLAAHDALTDASASSREEMAARPA